MAAPTKKWLSWVIAQPNCHSLISSFCPSGNPVAIFDILLQCTYETCCINLWCKFQNYSEVVFFLSFLFFFFLCLSLMSNKYCTSRCPITVKEPKRWRSSIGKMFQTPIEKWQILFHAFLKWLCPFFSGDTQSPFVQWKQFDFP